MSLLSKNGLTKALTRMTKKENDRAKPFGKRPNPKWQRGIKQPSPRLNALLLRLLQIFSNRNVAMKHLTPKISRSTSGRNSSSRAERRGWMFDSSRPESLRMMTFAVEKAHGKLRRLPFVRLAVAARVGHLRGQATKKMRFSQKPRILFPSTVHPDNSHLG